MANRIPLPYDYLPSVPAFTVVSEDIADGKTLDARHVYNSFGHSGGNVSPQLRWSGAPEGTRSFTVTCYDPDAPTASGFWHWVAVNLPASTSELPREAGSGDETLPGDAFHVRNDYGTRDYGGAAPPAGHGPHRYVFAVHAVGVEQLEVTPDVSPAVVGFNLFFHTLGRALIIPEYEV
jgi:Raf kinase inhibitor-like YbhB/YbcL family protein